MQRLLPGRDERPLAAVPSVLLAVFALALAGQMAWRATQPAPTATADQLTMPPSSAALRVLSVGDPIALGQLLTLRLQAFDNQPGISVPFAALDYNRVEAWLDAILDLDPNTGYPLLMAAQLYGQVFGHPAKQRQMSAFVLRQFLRDPDRRWQPLAHVAVMAKHRLHDLPLALRYATALRDHAHGPGVPGWARQMHIFLLEDLGEVETARVLLGGLLASGAITDEHEARFLTERLQALENAENSTAPPR